MFIKKKDIRIIIYNTNIKAGMKDGNIRSFAAFRRLNESAEGDFDVEYIRNCFADISDEFDLTIKEEEEYGSGYSWGTPKHVKVEVKVPKLSGKIVFDDEQIGDEPSCIRWRTAARYGLKHSISDLIKASADLNRILEMVDLSIKRLTEEYPEYKFTDNELLYRTRQDSDSPRLLITITK